MRHSQTYSWRFIPFCFIIILLCVAPELKGRMVISLGTASNGSYLTILGEGAVSLGTERTFSWEGLLGSTCMDLLENPRQTLSLSATIALDFAPGQRISMGDLGGLPALRLLLSPLEFPYSNLPRTFSSSSSLGKIPLVATDAVSSHEGLVYVFSRQSGLYAASFVFSPVFSPSGARGGGFVSLSDTSVGKLELGGCYAVRENVEVIPDEILYGRYPFTKGSFLQVLLRSNPLTTSFIRLHDTTLQTLVNLSYSHDPKLGGGILQGMSLIVNVGLLKVVWEMQSLPYVSGSPLSRIPSGDTYLQNRRLLELSHVSRFLSVDWRMNEKLWHLAPYSGSHQKRNYATTAGVTYFCGIGSFRFEQSTDISWNATGTWKRTSQASVTLQAKIGTVSTRLTPSYIHATNGDSMVSLQGGFQGELRGGLTWEASFRMGQKTTTLTMKALYVREQYRFECVLDELRRINLSFTIDR